MLNIGESTPEKTLWLAVLFQALLDATKPIDPKESEQAKLDRAQAIAWFESSVSSDTFKDVCYLAGLDPEYTRTFALKIILTNDHDFVRRRINTLLTHGEDE